MQKAVKTTSQTPYDKELFDSFPSADKELTYFLFATRSRPDLEAVNHDVVQ